MNLVLNLKLDDKMEETKNWKLTSHLL